MNMFYLTCVPFIKIINCQEQVKTIQQTEKKKNTSFLGVCIMSLTCLCDTNSK